jgi:hypothetical protein
MDKVTVGRIVHYVDDQGEHLPAIVVKVWDESSGCCNLQVFHADKQGSSILSSVTMGDASYTWHWPERN